MYDDVMKMAVMVIVDMVIFLYICIGVVVSWTAQRNCDDIIYDTGSVV